MAPLRVDTTSLPGGSVGVPYYFRLQASGGVPPYTWSDAFGLPPGPDLSSQGVITGTPVQVEFLAPSMMVTDSAGHTAVATLELVISGASTTTTTTTGPPVEQQTSDNWAGYDVQGGPYPPDRYHLARHAPARSWCCT